jgi:hypothetical protein
MIDAANMQYTLFTSTALVHWLLAVGTRDERLDERRHEHGRARNAIYGDVD